MGDGPTVGSGTRLSRVLDTRSARRLQERLGIETVHQLLCHFPRRFARRGELTSISGLVDGEHVTVLAEIRSATPRKMRSRNGTILDVAVSDGRRTLSLTFFNQNWRGKELKVGRRGLFAGKVSRFRGQLQLAHPSYELFDDTTPETTPDRAAKAVETVDRFPGALIPVYPSAEELPSWVIERCVRQVIDIWTPGEDPMPEVVLARYGLMAYDRAIRAMHQPDDDEQVKHARYRLRWQEALSLQLVLARRRAGIRRRSAPVCAETESGALVEFDAGLPFELTEGQRQVGGTIAEELGVNRPMLRLLQGEVGSGKTVVALRAMLQVVAAGRQAVLMAPTEVLATQHARTLAALLGPLGRAGQLDAAPGATEVALLTGSMPAASRRAALASVLSGAAGIVVGTHAVIQDHVQFADLGLVVIDEQHRFGVEQRDALRERGPGGSSPHMLVMTATPIPRTVALTAFGDLSVSTLRELPAGRREVATSVVPLAERPGWMQRVWQRLREEVDAGRQAYVICPRVCDEETDTGDTETGDADTGNRDAADGGQKAAASVTATIEQLREGPLAGLRLGMVHGRLPTADKDATMRSFAAGELDVLVSTTVVEVGVDVSNATTMVVLDAERFGMSQLHQLRGRIGRGGQKGLCLLVTELAEGTQGMQRLQSVAATADGFELSQLDLRLRREGDVLGAAQSGTRSGLRLLSLLDHQEIIEQASDVATELIEGDYELLEHQDLAEILGDMIDPLRAGYLDKA